MQIISVIRNMNVYWGSGLPDYFTHAVECKNFETIVIDGLHEKTSANSKRTMPTIYLHKGKASVVKGVTSTIKNNKLLIKDNNDN